MAAPTWREYVPTGPSRQRQTAGERLARVVHNSPSISAEIEKEQEILQGDVRWDSGAQKSLVVTNFARTGVAGSEPALESPPQYSGWCRKAPNDLPTYLEPSSDPVSDPWRQNDGKKGFALQ